MRPKHFLILGAILLALAGALFVATFMTGSVGCHKKQVGGAVTVMADEPSTPITAYMAAIAGLLGALSTLLSAVTKLVKVIRSRVRRPSRSFKAKYGGGPCPGCGKLLVKGQLVKYDDKSQLVHADC